MAARVYDPERHEIIGQRAIPLQRDPLAPIEDIISEPYARLCYVARERIYENRHGHPTWVRSITWLIDPETAAHIDPNTGEEVKS